MGNPKVTSGVITLKDQGGGVWGSVPEQPISLVDEDFSGGINGEPVEGQWQNTFYDSSRSVTGGQSARINLLMSDAPTSCSGSVVFAGRIQFPENVPVGRRVWVAMRMYEPSTLTGGYAYNSSDSSEAAACGISSLSPGFLKGIHVSPVSNTEGRVYVSPSVGRRDVARLPDGIIASEPAATTKSLSYPVISDRWYTQQIEVFVSDDENVGYIRYWRDQDFIGEFITNTVATPISEMRNAGYGNIWNGVPWTDGGPNQDEFWIDRIKVYSDIDGYGAPTGVDSGGRTYINPVTEI